MSEDASVDAAVEQVTQEVKDVKLENGSAPGALNGTANKAEGAISLKVLYRNILPTNRYQSLDSFNKVYSVLLSSS